MTNEIQLKTTEESARATHVRYMNISKVHLT